YTAQTSDSKKEPKRREWLEVELAFEIEVDREAPIRLADNVLFKYYIAIQGAGDVRYLLTQNVTYENVPEKEEMYAAVYVSPWSLARFMGKIDDFKESDILGVGVEVLFNGEKKGMESSAGGEFWNNASINFQRPQGMIMVKEKTPFAYMWIDRHAQAKQNN
ncbi:MAG: Amuc_1102 family pilus-like protein, partial [Verrucomicrobiota bacterium]